MQKIIVRGLSALLAVMFVSPAFAKAATEKLVISGPGIAGQIETTDAKAIAPSIWGGNFVDWNSKAVEPAATHARYTIKFHIRTAQGGSRVAYVVYYVWDPDAKRALVYIPGPGEEWYGVNASSILRDGSDGRSWRDGRWYAATDDWSRAIREVLER